MLRLLRSWPTSVVERGDRYAFVSGIVPESDMFSVKSFVQGVDQCDVEHRLPRL